jgi:hypothetical protein
MSRKRRPTRQANGSSRPSPPAAAARTASLQPIPEALKTAVEKAAEMAKGQLASAGKITPAALFVYGSDTAPETNRTTTVSLSWRNELQKELLRQRIREKALVEGAYAVVVLNVKDRALVISGRTSTNGSISASVDYAYQRDQRVVSRWDLHWLDKPAADFFLEGIFDRPPS